MAYSSKHRSQLITGLDCGLDHWTALLDWTTGLTFEIKSCVPHGLPTQMCYMFDALWLIDCHETKDAAYIQLW